MTPFVDRALPEQERQMEVRTPPVGFYGNGLEAPERREGDDLPRVVAFGGGTGMSTLLSGLRRYTDRLTAVVTVTDNGGSSGRLRNDFEIVPPGDIRNCLIALAEVDPLLIEAFQYRFTEGEFRGHCFGNLFITILTRIVGSFEGSIRELNRLLNVKGKILPAMPPQIMMQILPTNRVLLPAILLPIIPAPPIIPPTVPAQILIKVLSAVTTKMVTEVTNQRPIPVPAVK